MSIVKKGLFIAEGDDWLKIYMFDTRTIQRISKFSGISSDEVDYDIQAREQLCPKWRLYYEYVYGFEVKD